MFAFTTNADVADGIVFGKDIHTWLIYTLILLGLMTIAYLSVWLIGLIRDSASGATKQPWE